jgi:large subunit ribosomal protein L28
MAFYTQLHRPALSIREAVFTTTRAFSSTPLLSYSKPKKPIHSTLITGKGKYRKYKPGAIIPADAPIPAYPYGPNLLYKQSNRGLYGNTRIGFGNNVSKRSETHTRRSWKPNILNKSLYSLALRKMVKLRVSARVLRTIDKSGGLDEYLLKDKENRVKELGELGWKLRWRLMQEDSVRERLRREALALGLCQEEVDRHWGPLHESSRNREREAEVEAELEVEDAEVQTVS